jgi:hypothetical protein
MIRAPFLLALCGLLLVGGLNASAGRPATPGPHEDPDTPRADGDGADAEPRPIYVRSTLPGRMVVLSILPPGTRVEEGRLVCEFDARDFRDRLAYRQLDTERAEAEIEEAKVRLKNAELDLRTYVEAIHPRELLEADIEVIKAELALALARSRIEQAEDAGELEADVARFEADLAKHHRDVAKGEREALEAFGFDARRLRLEGDIEKAKAEVLARQARKQESKEREQRLRLAIEACKVYAPADGVIEYRERRIGPDAVVRRGALLFELHPDEAVEVDRADRGPGDAQDRPLLMFLARQLGPQLLSGERPSDEEIEALGREAAEALGRPVSASDIRATLDEVDRRRPNRPGGDEGPGRP